MINVSTLVSDLLIDWNNGRPKFWCSGKKQNIQHEIISGSLVSGGTAMHETTADVNSKMKRSGYKQVLDLPNTLTYGHVMLFADYCRGKLPPQLANNFDREVRLLAINIYHTDARITSATKVDFAARLGLGKYTPNTIDQPEPNLAPKTMKNKFIAAPVFSSLPNDEIMF